MSRSTHLQPEQTLHIKCLQIQTPRCNLGSDSDCTGHLLIVNDEVRVALVIIEDDKDLGVHPVVHAGVIEVARGVTRVDRWRPSHRGISYSIPSSEDFGQEHAVDSFRRAFGEVVRVDSFTGKVGSLSEHGEIGRAHV